MRSGKLYENMLATFDGAGGGGAELLSIESVGGKEIHDDALMNGDLRGVMFGLCVMARATCASSGPNWAKSPPKHGVLCAGDTACGFGNTAMVLAEQKMVPRVFAAVVRAISAVRTLVGYECGAVGPAKTAATKTPSSKPSPASRWRWKAKPPLAPTSAPWQHRRRHLRHLEQRIRPKHQTPGRHGPTCYMEQLIYDCRLMNQALADGPDAALLFANGWSTPTPRATPGLGPHPREFHCHRPRHCRSAQRLRGGPGRRA